MTKFEKKPLNGQEMANFLKERIYLGFKQSQVDFAYLGGSWVRQNNSWWSDIDLFISFPSYLHLDSKAQLTYLANLSVRFSELTDLDEIEILVLENLPLHVQFDVIHDGILLFERISGLKANFVEKLLPRYYDHIIWYKNLLKESKYLSSSSSETSK